MEGQTKRDIYLPIGFWQDGNSEKTFNGPTWVKDYPAGLDTLPYFIRLRPEPFSNTTTGKYTILNSNLMIFFFFLAAILVTVGNSIPF